MKTMKYIAIVIALIIVAGCATTFRPWNLSKIEPGMSKEQVVDILGKPSAEKQDGNVEWMEYSYTDGPIVTPMEGTGQNFDQQYPFFEERIEREMKSYQYVVKLQDGKVVTYEEIR